MLKNFMILCTTDIKISLFFILFKNGERYRFLVTRSVSCHFVCVCVTMSFCTPHRAAEETMQQIYHISHYWSLTTTSPDVITAIRRQNHVL